jgi:hypothetical protein
MLHDSLCLSGLTVFLPYTDARKQQKYHDEFGVNLYVNLADKLSTLAIHISIFKNTFSNPSDY